MRSSFVVTAYLLILISLAYLATDIYLPSLPAIAIYFQASDNEVQATLFTFLLSFSISPLVLGPLSDHIGRKKVILTGVLISIIAVAGCLCAPSIYWLSGFRCLQGIGAGGIMIAARASVSDMFTGQALARQMSFMTMLMPLVLAMAPTLGGFLQETFNWQAVFIFMGAYLICIFFMVLSRPESLKNSGEFKYSQMFTTYSSHFKNPLFLMFGINFVLPATGLFAYMTISPFLFQDMLGLSPFEYGSLSICIGATILLTSIINFKLIKRVALTQILWIGASLMTLAGVLLFIVHMMGILNIWTLLIPSLLYFTSIPLCLSNGAAKSFSLVKGHFGAATALLTTFQFFIGSLGSFVFSLMSNETALSLASCFILAGTLSLLNLSFACRLEKAKSSTQAL